MNLAWYTARLQSGGGAIVEFVRHVDVAQAAWTPELDQWSMRDVICHLYDEEKYDFRARIGVLASGNGGAFAPIDPDAWPREHRYAEQDIVEMRTLFRRERERSIAWLGTLEDVDWSKGYERSDGTILTAGDLLASWVAHDQIHLRQLARLQYGYLRATCSPFSPDYAGPW